jgi:hypothetical protein
MTDQEIAAAIGRPAGTRAPHWRGHRQLGICRLTEGAMLSDARRYA